VRVRCTRGFCECVCVLTHLDHNRDYPHASLSLSSSYVRSHKFDRYMNRSNDGSQYIYIYQYKSVYIYIWELSSWIWAPQVPIDTMEIASIPYVSRARSDAASLLWKLRDVAMTHVGYFKAILAVASTRVCIDMLYIYIL
jgi:hypothetical protein